MLAGLAGVLLAGFSTGGDTNVGNNYLFPGLAAVIVGGTMMGGRGDYLRTCLGALIITALNFVISVLNVNAAAQQVVFGALIAFTAYVWLLRVAPPVLVSTYAYVNPLVAVFLGWAVAGEPITRGTLIAAAVILAGVALISSAPKPAARPRTPGPSARSRERELETACGGG